MSRVEQLFLVCSIFDKSYCFKMLNTQITSIYLHYIPFFMETWRVYIKKTKIYFFMIYLTTFALFLSVKSIVISHHVDIPSSLVSIISRHHGHPGEIFRSFLHYRIRLSFLQKSQYGRLKHAMYSGFLEMVFSITQKPVHYILKKVSHFFFFVASYCLRVL